jgi:hypothetical protein
LRSGLETPVQKDLTTFEPGLREEQLAESGALRVPAARLCLSGQKHEEPHFMTGFKT